MIVLSIGLILILLGIWTMLRRKNLIRIIIGFSILDTGTHLVIVAIGYIRNATAPILDGDWANLATLGIRMVDPVPSALVLTAIVIGLAVTALMLSFAIRLFKSQKSLNIDDFEEQKW